jgi:DNA-binding NarL/FixJ family response regulator
VKDHIQILVVDDHPLFREGVVRTLDFEADMEIVGEATTADEARALAAELLPDVVLLDITIPGGGLSAVATIAASSPVTRIIMLTASEAEEDVLAALKSGARGYILKGVSGPVLTGIVRSVYAGESYVTPSLAASLLSDLDRPAGGEPHTALDDLSPREKQILEELASGQSNKEIAQLLNLSEKTVKHYMTNILQKLQVRNRVEAALLAQRNSLG